MSTAQTDSLRGIGGWLILFIIGLIVSPIRIGYFLLTEFWPIFRDGHWDQLTTIGNPAYHPFWAPLLGFEIVGNLLVIAIGLATLVFVFRKSKNAPILAIAWLTVMAVIVVADFFLADLIPALAETRSDPDAIKELIRSVVAAAIWIPYFLKSKRVAATFVE